MKRSLQLLLIAALMLGGWSQRGNYLSGGCSWLSDALTNAFIDALAELTSAVTRART